MAGLFIKLDTNFWSHPKIVAAGYLAGVLYQQMSSYCMDHATDGLVPYQQLSRFGLPKVRRHVEALAEVGLIERTDDGWMVPGYVERYKTAAEVAELREKRRAAGRQGGRPRKHQPDASSLRTAKANGKQVALTAPNPEYREQRTEIDSSSSSDTSAARPPGRADEDADAADLPTELLRLAGYTTTGPNHGERATVATLQRRGWTPDQLRGMALRASQADVDPRAYLAKLLAEALNARPGDGTSRPPERRPLLDDERTPCTDCGASGWVDAADGTGVLRCTTCTGART